MGSTVLLRHCIYICRLPPVFRFSMILMLHWKLSQVVRQTCQNITKTISWDSSNLVKWPGLLMFVLNFCSDFIVQCMWRFWCFWTLNKCVCYKRRNPFVPDDIAVNLYCINASMKKLVIITTAIMFNEQKLFRNLPCNHELTLTQHYLTLCNLVQSCIFGILKPKGFIYKKKHAMRKFLLGMKVM